MDRFSASYHQERLWFIDHFEKGNLYPDSPLYHNLSICLKLDKHLNFDLLKNALEIVQERHEALRTSVVFDNEDVFQEINDDVEVPCIRLKSDDKPELSMLRDWVYKTSQQPIDLRSKSLLRSFYMEFEVESVLLIVVHHAVIDRQSMDILLDDLLQIYSCLEQKTSIQLPELELQYVDFSDWQRSLPSETIDNFMLYWKGNLHGLAPLKFQTDFPREEVHIYETSILYDTISADSLKIGDDPFYSFLLAYKILLYKYSSQKEIVCGVQHENRDMPELKGVIGAISNLLVLNDKMEEHFTISEVKKRIISNHRAAVENAAIPFDLLVKLINPKKDMSRTALFDVLFQYVDRSQQKDFLASQSKENRMIINTGLGKYDYNLLVIKKLDEFELQFTYNSKYYTTDSANRFMRHFKQVLLEISNDSKTLGEISILSDEEERRIVEILDNTDVNWPENEDIVSLFTQQAQKHPARIALKFGEEELSYGQLDALTNRFAHFISEKYGVQEGDLVGLLLPRGIYQVVSILAVLKSNAIYVPIDLEYPEERVTYTLDDSKAKICLNETLLEEFLNSQHDFSDESRERKRNPNSCAYVIYTSGSTGLPKGVQVSHQNVIRLFKTSEVNYAFTELDNWTMFHSYCFDFSVWEMYGALLFGGKLILISKDVAIDPKALLNLLNDEKVTIFNSTPSVFYNLLKIKPWEFIPRLALKSVIFGGEKLTTSKLTDWIKHYPETDLINMYGITETTVHVTYKKIDQETINSGISNIGVPIPSLSCLILDDQQKVLPELIPGELWIGGAGVSLGYLNRSELNKERFRMLPNRDGLYYRSGDKVRLLSNGDIEYLGRIDDQVKIRGFRIELGEVTAALSKFKQSVQVVVACKEIDENAVLVAYYTSSEEVNERSFRNYASSKLPTYMIPQFFVHLDDFPVTINGKVDLDKLPNPKIKHSENQDFAKPSTEAEKTIAESWTRILSIDSSAITLESDFFELGGDSLKASVFINDILDKLGVKLNLDQVFSSVNLAHLSEMIEESEKEQERVISLVQENEPLFLTSAQTGMWFVSQMDKLAAASYNMIQPILVKGEFNEVLFQKSLKQLCIRHESLRTNIVMSEFGLVQKIRTPDTLGFFYEKQTIERRLDESYETYSTTLKREKRHAFDLAQGPLLRVTQLSFSGNQTAIIFNIHHIISDGWSMSLFFQELIDNYNKMVNGTFNETAPDKVQFKDYAKWIRHQLESNQQTLNAFWSEYLNDLPASILPKQQVVTFEGRSQSANLPDFTKEDIADFCKEKEVTPFMFFWTICADTLSKIFGSNDIVMVSPNSIRPRKEFEKVMGLCLNTLPIRCNLNESNSFVASLKIVKTSIEKARRHDYLPLSNIAELLRNQANYNDTTFSILFAFQNQENLSALEEIVELENVVFEFLPNESETAKYGLCLSVRVQEAVHIDIEYNIHIVSEQTIMEIFEHIKEALGILLKQKQY